MNADVWTAASSLLGGIGGAAGVVALWLQLRDRLHRKRISHIPPEAASLLRELVNIGLHLERRSEGAGWLEENLRPLWVRWRPIDHLAVAAFKGDRQQFADLSNNIQTVLLQPVVDVDRDPLNYLETSDTQRIHARRLTDAATALHHKLTGHRPVVGRPGAADEAPRTKWRMHGVGKR